MGIVKSVYLVTKCFPREEIYGLTSQIKRSAVSVPSNIAEGSQRGSSKEFAYFISVAKGSLAELETQLLLAVELGYSSSSELEKILLEIGELKKMIYVFRKSLATDHLPLATS